MADDPEGGRLFINAPVKPDWLTLVDNGNGTALIVGTPTAADVGTHAIQIDVTDDAGLVRSQNFDLVVVQANGQTYLPFLVR